MNTEMSDEERRQALAKLVVADWDMDTLIVYAEDRLQEFYEKDKEAFENDWEEYGPDSR